MGCICRRLEEHKLTRHTLNAINAQPPGEGLPMHEGTLLNAPWSQRRYQCNLRNLYDMLTPLLSHRKLEKEQFIARRRK